MAHLSLLSSPFLLGFDQLERSLDRLSKTSSEGYPPYNIEQLGEDRLRITLAVAGFNTTDLVIQLENNQLQIRGRQSDDEVGRIFLHRGIAGRQFQRSFVLVDGIEVIGASLDNGLLHVDLRRPVANKEVRTIAISTAKSSSLSSSSSSASKTDDANHLAFGSEKQFGNGRAALSVAVRHSAAAVKEG